MSKDCIYCGIILDESNVHKNGNRKLYDCKACHNKRHNYYRNMDKIKCIKEYGNECVCCGESKHQFLTINHIKGDGNKHRKEINEHIWTLLRRMGFPKDDYELMCFNCNCTTGIFGECPHVLEKQMMEIPLEIGGKWV